MTLTKPAYVYLRKGYVRTENGALITLANSVIASNKWSLTIAYRSWDDLSAGTYKLIDLPVGSLSLKVLSNGNADLKYVNAAGSHMMGVELDSRDWIAIMIAFNTRTLTAVIESCDRLLNNTANKQISVEMADSTAPRNSIVLHGDSHNSSWKNLTFYNAFHDMVQMDECIDMCVVG